MINKQFVHRQLTEYFVHYSATGYVNKAYLIQKPYINII